MAASILNILKILIIYRDRNLIIQFSKISFHRLCDPCVCNITYLHLFRMLSQQYISHYSVLDRSVQLMCDVLPPLSLRVEVGASCSTVLMD